MLKRILVVLGGTPYTRPAIQHAVELARRHRARVTGIAILDPDAAVNVRTDPTRSGIEVVRERIDGAVEEFERAMFEADIEHSVFRDEGDPVRTLCRAWRYQDLTIVGLRGLFEYGVIAEPKDALVQLITSGMRPILAVSRDYRPIDRAMIAYSGSAESAKTMKRFLQLRLWPKAETSLLHYIEGSESEGEVVSLLHDATAYAKDWGVEIDAQAVVGGPKDHLLRDARERRADLIVMSDSAKSLFKRRVFGDAALHVIRNADRPLFLAH